MATLTRQRAATPPERATPSPATVTLLLEETSFGLRELARSRIVVVLTLLFPLVWLVLLGALIGDTHTDGPEPVPIMQFVTPTAGVMGVLFGTFPAVAGSLAEARERGLLKRVRGTPLPVWVNVAGRVCAATVLALVSLVVMVLVGVVAYDVEIQWRTAPATAVTALVAILSFAAVGLAVATLSRTAATARAMTLGGAVTVGFLSGVLAFGDMPAWADRVASVFPLKPFSDALQEQFDPTHDWSGWDLGALAMLLAWGGLAAAVTVRGLRFDPADHRRTPTGEARIQVPAGRAGPTTRPTPVETRRPNAAHLFLEETRWALLGHARDLGLIFFSLLMPLGLYLLIESSMAGSDVALRLGEAYHLRTAVGMVGWSVLMTAFLSVPEAAAAARDRGPLKRLRGTPMPVRLHVGGRAAAGVLITLVAGALVVGASWATRGLDVAWSWLPVSVLLLVLGATTLTACGFALAGALHDSRSVNAAALGISLPVSFFSGVFGVGQVPEWMESLGSLLPVRPMVESLVAALDGSSPSLDGGSVLVMVLWLLAASVVALRLWRRDEG